MSPKHCSLAYDVEEDFLDKVPGSDEMGSSLKVVSHKRFVENSSLEELVFVKGRINVSF
ncbi:hypothetical protein [Estrella lausannensis]|uniref:hypothetical protein n=1 Tax=Estrella lausannensis TaxID=483423 RepID=UPI0013043AE9|nr:hypothetical protein [Estrella lausannensis]